VERVKAITGGDAITARALYRNPVTFEPTHTVWLSTNHQPRVPDDGAAIWDRLLLIPWPVRIAEEDRVAGLAERLAAEQGPWVLRWAIDGAVDYLAGGLAVPEAIRAATAGYREREDVFAAFLAERTDAGEQATVTAGDLLRAYREWSAIRPSAPPLSDATLRERMAALGFESVRRARRSYFLGVRLVEVTR
jgi:putative DNA primase/helicase